MKKVVIIMLSIIFVIGLFFLLFNKHISNEKKYISNLFNVDISNCDLIEEYNNHGGFLGDGESLYKLKCSNFNASEDFKELPFGETLDEVMNMISCDEEKCATLYERYEIPSIEKGYYKFIDRHSDAEDKSSEIGINDRASYNFSILMYDEYNKMLYCYELDT